MEPNRSLRRATLLALLLCGTAACHHRPATTEYIAARDAPRGVGEIPATPLERPVPSASAEIRNAELASGERRVYRIEELFVGRFPGLDVHRTTDGSISMRLRGVEPLLVIDGTVSDPFALLLIPPNRVRQIEVLRNISETAIYGSRGVNGVVRVTTHR